MENKKPKPSNLIWLISSIVAIGLIVKCNSNSNSENTISNDLITDSSGILTDTVQTVKHVWEYLEDEDKMTSEIKYFASLEANDPLYFDSPYDGGSVATFIIRHKDGFGNAYLKVSKGQFIVHTYSRFRIRFDNGKAKQYAVSSPTDGSSDVVFFEYYQLIDKIKKHKKMIVEAEFYQEGFRPIEFNIEGLKWNH